MLALTFTCALAAQSPAAPNDIEPRWFGLATDLSEQGLDLFAIDPTGVQYSPYATVIGGVNAEHIERSAAETDERQDRVATIALARTGLAARAGRFFSLESEIEFNAGPYGTSVWEGQAAIQVRNQLLRFEASDLVYHDRVKVELGRITDETSLNYFSRQAADQLLSDEIARLPILFAGFNRGNGVQLRYTLFDTVTLGATFNAGNPTSTTGTLMVGGTFPPFARFYEVPQASVGRDARNFPVSSFHVMLLSPSIQLDTRFIRAKVSTQLVSADTNMNSESDAPLQGFNVRGGIEATVLEDVLWDNRLTIFVNGSRIENDVVRKDDLSKLQNARYEAFTGSAGVDIDLWGKSGIGAEVAFVREREPGSAPTMIQFANLGATWWLNDAFSLSARGAYTQNCQDFDCDVDGVRSLFVTARMLLGPPATTRP